jgi:archaeosine-15-forming tRNA-guanine transglycosylase
MTYKEDKVYLLLGIFNVYILLIYSKRKNKVIQQLWEEIKKASKSIFFSFVIEIGSC